MGSNRRTFCATVAATLFTTGLSTRSRADATSNDPVVYIGAAPDESGLSAIAAQTGEIIWSTTVIGHTDSEPIVVDGTVYINRYAFDAATGDLQWESDKLTGSIRASPTVVGDTVYIGDEAGDFYALDAASGAVKWTISTGNSAIESSAEISGDTVYFGTNDGDLFAVDINDGSINWKLTDPTETVYTPAVGDSLLWFTTPNALFAVRPGNGAYQWVTAVDGTPRTPPVVAGNYLYFSSSHPTGIRAHDVETGETVWFSEGGGPPLPPAYAEGTVFQLNGPVAYNSRTGAEQWGNYDLIYGTPTVFEGSVYAFDGRLKSYDAETGDRQLGDDAPLLSPDASSPTVVTDPQSGDSVGSRVMTGIFGHHHTIKRPGPGEPGRFSRERLVQASERQSVAFGSGVGLSALGYLGYRRYRNYKK